ncbi:MAG: mandelate racemase/muconate lactonizing enzyme family protein [Elusimicrobiota bacterium]|nr:MAG: mandelate racemase/muconate lactonizing enzyme family protein [Elusimicrobiota bacterium]
MKLGPTRLAKLRGFALSSPFGSGYSLGQPLGVKSVGFVEAVSEDGCVGWGETYAGVYVPELIEPAVRALAPLLEGKDIVDIAAATQGLLRIPFVGRDGLLRSVAGAVDIALWDLESRRRGVPLAKLWGAAPRPDVAVYASAGSAALSPDEVARDAREALAAGHERFKMRVGFQDWTIDLERVRAAREALGPDRELMVDAIMGTVVPAWDADTALRRIKDIEPFRLRWVEEPVAPDDFEGMKKVKAGSSLPIAAGEAYTAFSDFERVLADGSVDVLQPDATHSGGFSAVRAIADRAGAAKRPLALHVWGSQLAGNAHLILGAALPGVEVVERPAVAFALDRAIARRVPTVARGLAVLEEAPGLGVEIDDAVRREFRLVEGSGYRWGAKAKA